ncbi:glycosyl transferase [Roseovarius sp. TE539]|uniref:TIGR04283 family arsenosugar biosynthesis glycosyltransferase n=1 Tax=Roseovarius sp. TE539 TaxID=2249812 RepID=UPI000DDE3921|nr:TIGR04283 family arsenosugar biosynthesis glycosyltransferase [Roseovarius sp. TE539]RBI70139.1 glycosyl transferase [Roseovarius sp. TE539]
MRAELSVVIPTLNAAEALPGCLAALTEGLQAGLIRELVISDGGSADATREIADAAGAVLLAGPPSRGGQLRRGAATAEGEWLLFLHADTRLADGWAAVVRAQMKSGRPGYFKLGFDAAGLAPALVSGWANLRSRLFHLPYGDQGLLVSRTDYDAAGGYPDIPIMEDVALARRLGGRLQAMPLRVSTSAARYRRDGWLRRGSGNLILLLRYLSGTSPERLLAHYRGPAGQA